MLWSQEDAATSGPRADPDSDTCLTWALGFSFLKSPCGCLGSGDLQGDKDIPPPFPVNLQ